METRIKQAIEQEMKTARTPFYLYDQQTVVERVGQLQRALPAELLYSVKVNNYAPVVKTIFEAGVGADAASLQEVEMAAAFGLPREKILYSAPARTREELARAMDKCIVTADSFGELTQLDRLAAEKGVVAPVGVRLKPNFTMFAGTGAPSKFGIDEEQFLEAGEFLASLRHLRIVGLHIHVATQILDAALLCTYYGRVLELTRKVRRHLELPLEFVNMGGGIGLVYDKGEPLDLERVGACLAELKEGFAQLGVSRMIVETGRFLVCECGYYCARIVDIKQSRGEKFLLVQNTLNGFLRPALCQMIEGFLPGRDDLSPNEPYYTSKHAFGYSILGGKEDEETVSVGGHLCTAADIIVRGIQLPRAEVGDILVVDKAGSYAYALSPVQFSGHPAPYQVMLTRDGQHI